MAETFCAILTAHLLGVFLFRPAWIGPRARTAGAAVARGAAVALFAGLLLGAADWRILAGVLAVSTAAALVEVRAPDSVGWFAAEQSVSLACLLALSGHVPEAAAGGWWAKTLPPDIWKWYFAGLAGSSGLVACVFGGGVLIGKVMRPFTAEVWNDDIAGLARGGRYIGWLERLLVFLLVLMHEPNGIGFLIAAKSILRFGEIKDTGQRKVAEYIIIGTFASFAWALFVSVLTQKSMRHWIP